MYYIYYIYYMYYIYYILCILYIYIYILYIVRPRPWQRKSAFPQSERYCSAGGLRP